MALGRGGAADRHEVDEFADAAVGEEPGDENGGVGEVELLAVETAGRRLDPEVPAALGIEQRAEDARGVEAGAAEPVNGSVGRDQGRGLQVTDKTVVGDQWVVRHESLLELHPAVACDSLGAYHCSVRRGRSGRILRTG